MNTKTIIVDIGCNEPPIAPKSVNHRCTIPNMKKSTKELEVMDIDWSKAPEGCIGALQSNNYNYPYKHGRFVKSCNSFDNYAYCADEEFYPCM